MDHVDVNTATRSQISVLLGLSTDEVERVLAARPFASGEALRDALPARFAGSAPDLALPKLDVNAVSRARLTRDVGFTPAVADAIVANRPYYFLAELRRVPGVAPVYHAIEALFAAPELAYTDKLTGRPVRLAADPTRLLVEEGDGEGAFASSPGATALFSPRARRAGYSVISVSEAETADLLPRLRRERGAKVVPAFRDGRLGRRYLDPEYCAIQFVPEAAEDRQRAILAEVGLEIHERHRSAGLFTLRVPRAAIEPHLLTRALAALNGRPEVKFVEPSYLGFDDAESSLAAAPGEAGAARWNLALAGVPGAWEHGRGSPSVVVAVVDSGADEAHPALRGAILRRGPNDDWNFAGTEGDDEEGHGTFIAGLLVGNGALGVDGICPGCLLMPLKVPLKGELTSYARRRDAILYALDHVPPGARLVINLSWKTTGDVALIRDAIEVAAARGAVVVASAGNWPVRVNEPHYPSDYPAVISVAAVGPDRARADYSYSGDEVDVSAPGGADPQSPGGSLRSAAPGGAVTTSCGTSFAAPHVAGIAALLLSKRGSLTPAEVRHALESSAAPLADPGMGRGLVDAAAALDAADPGDAGAEGPPAAARGALDAINGGDLEALVARFGLLPITARILVARRPYAGLDRIRGTLGLSEDQYARLAGHRATEPRLAIDLRPDIESPNPPSR